MQIKDSVWLVEQAESGDRLGMDMCVAYALCVSMYVCKCLFYVGLEGNKREFGSNLVYFVIWNKSI